MAALHANPNGAETLLTIDEAADRLRVTRDWLRHRTRDLPFALKLSEGVVRYSGKALDAYVATKTRRKV